MTSYISSLDLNGPQGKLNNVFYYADGNGPHPLLIFAHGFPGHEKNFALAQDLRDRGFHVLIFFYSGCWGSEGFFSFQQSAKDFYAVLEQLPVSDEKIDKNNIFVLGHSVGCLPAAVAATQRSEIRGCIFLMPCDIGTYYQLGLHDKDEADSFRTIIETGLLFVNGLPADKVLREVSESPESFSFAPYLEALSRKPLLWISGKLDRIAEEKYFSLPYREKLSGSADSKIEWRSLRTDHYYSNARQQVVYEIACFLNRHLSRSTDSFSAQTFSDVFTSYLSTQYPTATLQNAADWFGISISYLSSLIRKNFGKNFTEMLTEVKMNSAAELLKNTDMSLTEISDFLGYGESSYFMKVFKKHYQVTPTEYKNGYERK